MSKNHGGKSSAKKLNQRDWYLLQLIKRLGVIMSTCEDPKERQEGLFNLNKEWEEWLSRHPLYQSSKANELFMQQATAFIKFRTAKAAATVVAKAQANNSMTADPETV